MNLNLPSKIAGSEHVRTPCSAATSKGSKSGKSLSKSEQRELALNHAVSAYTKAIEILTYRGEKDLLSQAQNELGDIYASFDNWDKAIILWNDCVDGITGTCGKLSLQVEATVSYREVGYTAPQLCIHQW